MANRRRFTKRDKRHAGRGFEDDRPRLNNWSISSDAFSSRMRSLINAVMRSQKRRPQPLRPDSYNPTRQPPSGPDIWARVAAYPSRAHTARAGISQPQPERGAPRGLGRRLPCGLLCLRFRITPAHPCHGGSVVSTIWVSASPAPCCWSSAASHSWRLRNTSLVATEDLHDLLQLAPPLHLLAVAKCRRSSSVWKAGVTAAAIANVTGSNSRCISALGFSSRIRSPPSTATRPMSWLPQPSWPVSTRRMIASPSTLTVDRLPP